MQFIFRFNFFIPSLFPQFFKPRFLFLNFLPRLQPLSAHCIQTFLKGLNLFLTVSLTLAHFFQLPSQLTELFSVMLGLITKTGRCIKLPSLSSYFFHFFSISCFEVCLLKFYCRFFAQESRRNFSFKFLYKKNGK